MENPKKIIFKFKNKNRRIQYNCYIFLGSLVENNIKNILEKIKDKNLFDTLVSISKKDNKLLSEKYGIYWYKFFFNFSHLEYEFRKIINNENKLKQLKKKFGKEWLKNHIKINKLILPKLRHSYKFKTSKVLIYNIMVNKKRQKNFILSEDKSINDYRLENKIQKGGGEDDSDDDDDEGTFLDNTNYGSVDNESESIQDILSSDSEDEKEEQEEQEEDNKSEEIEGVVIQNKLDDFSNEIKGEEINLEEVETEFNRKNEADDKLNETTKLIDRAIEQGKMKKIKEKMNEFPDEKNNNMSDENIKNNFNKIYIYTSYIFDDDSIKKIKQKISVSIINNPIFINKFKHDNFIVPSRIYLFSKHKYKDRFNSSISEEKIMIGQKWIRKNELLKIDIEPSTNLKDYENLSGNLKYLTSNILKSSSKIRRENNQSYLYNHYKEYIQNNEIFMMDIYNELGINYSKDKSNQQIKNIFDSYIRIYFPEIIYDDFKKLLDYLNIENNDQIRRDEITYIRDIYETNKNDLFLESQITSTIEDLKTQPKLYDKIIKYNYITQAVTHILLDEKSMSDVSRKKLDLFRIFDNFILNDKYPFIQWQTSDGSIIFKYYNKSTEKDKDAILAKWIQHAPYGISFKVKTNIKDLSKNLSEFKYIAINLNENGRLEYKTQYKEDNQATMKDIYDTYDIVTTLLKKINSENKTIKFIHPKPDDFKFAFINSIIKFELPKKAVINHNQLSELCRYFYPYIVLVIEPRKREAKIKKESSKSKYGTYLRYKRIDNYDTEQRIELKIIYFLKNYEFNINALAIELSKQYNITEKEALNKINEVKSKFNVRRIRKVLKKLNEIPKLKTPGIEIEIQGKSVDNYKIRISGARNKEQLDKIIRFLEILIFLYYDTYINKSSKRVKLLETLKVLHNIAKRRNKVFEPKMREDETKTVKQLIKGDPDRLGFKPKQGQDHYTRACQNSGKKKRQPQKVDDISILKLKGYKLNEKTGLYEKEVTVKSGKSKEKTVIKTVKLKGKSGDIYYFCSPEENGKYMHIGFLTRSINPNGLCMPCCYKIDQSTKFNNPQRDFFLKCIGKEENIELKSTKIYGDKLYILQDTNKIQEGRYGMLPKFLDSLLNKNFNKSIKIENHYLIEAETGYLLKYGVNIREFQFINCMKTIFNITKDEFIDKVKLALNKNKNILYFLNSGDTITQFINKENFFTFLDTSMYLGYELISDIFSIPNVFSEFGYNIFLFEKITYKDNYTDKIKQKYIINCPKDDILHYFNNDKYKNLFILKEDNFYYPIFEITKEKNAPKFKIYKSFEYNSDIITTFRKYINENCKNNINSKINYSCRKIASILEKNNIKIKVQIMDNRNKCVYLFTNNFLLPVHSSGCSYKYDISNDEKKYLLSLEKTLVNYKNFMKVTKKDNSLSSNFYEFRGFTSINDKKDTYEISGILLNDNLIIPIKSKKITYKNLQKISSQFGSKDFVIENVAFDKEINEAIFKNEKVLDSRMKQISLKNFEVESYHLFKLELSDMITNNKNISTEIDSILKGKFNKKYKIKTIKNILYKLIDKKLYKLLKQKGGDINIEKNIKINDKYTVNNTRELCNIHKKKDECNNNNNCIWKGKNCKLKINYEYAVKFINRIVEEMIDSEYKANEILQKDEYFVSDIVDYNSFTPRQNQTIIRSNSMNANIILSEIFGENSIPNFGKKKSKQQKIYHEQNIKNPYEQIGSLIYQRVKSNNIIFRVLANVFYWIKNPTFNIEDRNLGYYSPIQSNIANYIRGKFINWLSNIKNWKFIKNNFKNIEISKGYIGLDNYINSITNKNYKTDFKTELILFNIIFKIPIYIMNNSNKIIETVINSNIKSINNYNIDNLPKIHIIIKYESNKINNKFTNIYAVYKTNI